MEEEDGSGTPWFARGGVLAVFVVGSGRTEMVGVPSLVGLDAATGS